MKLTYLTTIPFTAALLFQASVGLAQNQSDEEGTAAPSTSDGIVVEGERERQRVREAARTYIEAVEIGRTQQQTARWADKICPGVFGLEGEIADIMIDRIRFIAESAGAPVAKRKCKTNLSVIFADDGAEFVSQVRSKSHRQLNEIPRHQRDFVYTSDAPVRWWYTSELMGSGGKPLVSDQPLLQCEGCLGGQPIKTTVDTKFNQQFSNSRIRRPTERHIRTASVVIDERQAAGTKIDSLAEYVAFVALAEIWPSSSTAQASTILTLFDDSEGQTGEVRTLTQQDERFLCALYNLPLDRSVRRQKSRLVLGIAEGDYACPGFDQP